jgi:hypothetical protein
LELPDSPPAELFPAAEPAPESIGDPLGACPGDELLLEAEVSGAADGELGADDGGVLLAIPPGGGDSLPVLPVVMSPGPVFLERLLPELVSRAEFLHAARPNRGKINAMASNAFKFICSPPFVDFDSSRMAASLLFSAAPTAVN